MDTIVLYILAGLGLLFAVPFLLFVVFYIGVRLFIFLFPIILFAVVLSTVYVLGRLFICHKK